MKMKRVMACTGIIIGGILIVLGLLMAASSMYYGAIAIPFGIWATIKYSLQLKTKQE